MTAPGRRRWFTLLLVALNVGLALGVYLAYRTWWGQPGGIPLNRMAWEASFEERGLALPAEGPREGYWGARLGQKVADPDTRWREPEIHIPGKVEIDAQGLQHVAPTVPARGQLLIVGGSVAFGAYASDIRSTYFARLVELLEARGFPIRVTVMASGGWWSGQERRALEAHLAAIDPDWLLLLDGVNDLIRSQGPSLERRAQRYLANVEAMRGQAARLGIPLVVALQPFLPGKRSKTALEERILALSLDPQVMDDRYLSASGLRTQFEVIRSGLAAELTGKGARFVDCSGALDDETETTFTDVWHFADPGHELLARCLAQGLLPTLEQHPAR